MEFKILDENPGKKTMQTAKDRIGENVYYSVFTTQIEDVLDIENVYELKEGDIVVVTVKNTNLTFAQQIKDTIYTAHGADIYTIKTTQSALVTATGDSITSDSLDTEVEEPQEPEQPEENPILASKVKVGDYVKYIPNSSTYTIAAQYTGDSSSQTISTDNLNWRVLKIDGNQITLISESPTTSTIALSGIDGYNNAVYILNNMCSKLYSKSGISESVRNLNFDDVKEVLSDEFWNVADTSLYGQTVSKTTSEKYPNISLQDSQVTINGNIGDLSYSEQSELVTGGQYYSNTSIVSNYIYSPTASPSYYTDPIYYELFTGSFFLSTRSIASNVGFRVYMMWSNAIAPGTLYEWNETTIKLDYGFRPVITLRQGIETTGGTGTAGDPYII